MPRMAELSAATTTGASVFARHATQGHDASNRAIANRSIFLFLHLANANWGWGETQCRMPKRPEQGSILRKAVRAIQSSSSTNLLPTCAGGRPSFATFRGATV